MQVFRFILLVAAACLSNLNSFAQDEKKSLLIDLSYYVKNNNYPYLIVYTKYKEERKFVPVPNQQVKVYITEESESSLLGKVTTDINGKGFVVISDKFKPVWDSLSTFTFLASAVGDKIYEPATTEINITKAKIFLDSVPGAETKSLVATVLEQHSDNTLTAKDVELKIIIKRMAGNLSVGDEETYTTDSTGTAVAEFKKENIPGDKDGYIIVAAKAEDNDTYGNLYIEKQIKWGAPFLAANNNFNRRTLFATRDKSPLWLLALAYSIGLGVWGTLIYLITRIIRIRKIGIQSAVTSPGN
jgi:hypothetical protein